MPLPTSPTDKDSMSTADTSVAYAGSGAEPVVDSIRKAGEQQSPSLFHRLQHNRSILSLVVSDDSIFAGTQAGDILVGLIALWYDGPDSRQVWSLETYQLRSTLHGHTGSVLCLFLAKEPALLFSSAGDAIVNVSSWAWASRSHS